MFNIKTDTQGEISSSCFVSVLRDVPSDSDRYLLSALNSSSLCLMCALVTSSECSWNQISVVIDMTSEVMPLLLRHYKGLDGDCHSGMHFGAARKPRAGNLMRLKPSYTHSIFPQHDVGTKGFKWKEGGVWYFAGYRSFSTKHWICAWLTSYNHIMASLESMDALTEAHSGCLRFIFIDFPNSSLIYYCNHSICTLSAPDNWCKGTPLTNCHS